MKPIKVYAHPGVLNALRSGGKMHAEVYNYRDIPGEIALLLIERPVKRRKKKPKCANCNDRGGGIDEDDIGWTCNCAAGRE